MFEKMSVKRADAYVLNDVVFRLMLLDDLCGQGI